MPRTTIGSEIVPYCKEPNCESCRRALTSQGLVNEVSVSNEPECGVQIRFARSATGRSTTQAKRSIPTDREKGSGLFAGEVEWLSFGMPGQRAPMWRWISCPCCGNKVRGIYDAIGQKRPRTFFWPSPFLGPRTSTQFVTTPARLHPPTRSRG